MPDIKDHPTCAADISLLVPYYRSLPVYRELVELNHKVSMLHPDVLAILYHLGGHCIKPILEIGPYIGGSTIAMSMGIRRFGDRQRIVTIELGGTLDHPQHGSLDIVKDLVRNLEAYGASGYADVLVGNSRHQDIVSAARGILGKSGVGLFFIDADGQVDMDLDRYGDLMGPGAYLVVDDYFSGGDWAAPEDKVVPTKSTLDSLEKAGKVECLGIYGWGTWVGVIK
jgi:predicted O-methyltransferase YrrM